MMKNPKRNPILSDIIKLQKLAILSIVIFLFVFSIPTIAQSLYTPYDELPNIIKSYKPAYDDNYPEWGKKLYQYPINFNEICREFDQYLLEEKPAKSALIRYFKIWRRAIEPFASTDGTIQLPDIKQMQKNLKLAQESAGLQLKSAKTENNWSFLGPKETHLLYNPSLPNQTRLSPWQANVYSFDVAESANNILYCGTETGFVNKTIDKGISWQQIGLNYPFGGGVTATVIHPQNPDIVYVAAGNQIHKTTDGGISWKPLLYGSNIFSTDRLKIDKINPQKIIAATSKGVFITIDGGVSWQNKWNEQAFDIDIKPDNNQIIYAIVKSNTGNFSVVISTNGGNTFSSQSGFPSTVPYISGGLLAVTPANPNLLFAVLLSSDGSGTNTPYIYKGIFSNGIFNWSKVATGKTTAFPMDNGQGYFDLVLEVDPNNQNIIFTGTTTLYKSLNGGITFSAVGGYIGSFNIHPDIQDMKILQNGEMYVSTDGGISLSTDRFTSTANYFIRISGLIGSHFWGFDQGWNEDIVVGGRYHNGNTAIADFYNEKALLMGGAESPTGWVLKGKSRHVVFDDIGNGYILPKNANSQIEGRFSFGKFPNMDEYGGLRGNLLHHPNYYGVLYLGEGNGFWKSNDMGLTFDLINTFPDRVRYIQISYSNPEVIYADVINFGLFKTIDGGYNWTLKPALTSQNSNRSYWKGKLFFDVSPYDPNKIYALLQNGSWSKDIGKVLRSTDGGESWEDWTGQVSDYLKCLVIQPTTYGKDLVYLITTSVNGNVAKVFYRKETATNWTEYSANYPAGMQANHALPFYRDSKLRVAGTCGVWEVPFAEKEYTPIITPWIDKPTNNCMNDTLYFDDHSILNHEGASWEWQITPTPIYFSNRKIRNPKVVLGNPGHYNVTLSVTKNGRVYSKTVNNMLSTKTCPSIDDCCNPGIIPVKDWSLIYADSEEKNTGLATMAFDNNPETSWHTRWSTGVDPYPHEIQIDMNREYNIHTFKYLTSQTGWNGWIKSYELYISKDKNNWGNAVKVGDFEKTTSPKIISFDAPITGRYMKLKALSEVNGGPWTSAAEIVVLGCKTGLKPTISCPAIKTDYNVDWGLKTFKVTGTDLDPTIGENCIGGIFNNNYNNQASLKNAVFPLGRTTVIWKVTDISGNVTSCSYDIVVVDKPTNAESEKSISELKAFPIPTNGLLNISLPSIGPMNFIIQSATGQEVDRGEITGNNSAWTIDLKRLNSGIYLIILGDNKGSNYRIKVIKN